MTYGFCDLKLAEALGEERKAAALRSRIRVRRRHRFREGPPERSEECSCVALCRPAQSGAVGNN